MFSIVIPTWNNLEFLKLAVDSIRKHSQFEHEIIIHVNEGADGTLEWVRQQGLKYSHTEKNVGVCLSVNHLVAQACHDWVLYMNDDMVACPGWDTAFIKASEAVDTDLCLFFGTLIQADNGRNPYIVEQNFGTNSQDFDEPRMLKEFLSEKRSDVDGADLQPTFFNRRWWVTVGGYSLEFSPGMSSDDDLLMKFWVVGCRVFRIIGASRFYHFSCKSTGRVRRNKGGREFLMKWGINQRAFKQQYLASLRSPATVNFPRSSGLDKIRRAGYSLLHNHPLEDIELWDPVPGQGKWQHSDK